MANRKTFCILPWIHSFVSPAGDYQICCTAGSYHLGITNSDGKIFNILDQAPQSEIMNSDFMKNLRLKMINGEMDSACTRCMDSEKLDGVSRRLIENTARENDIEALIKATALDGKIDVKYKFLDYRLGNFCNLECRMCGPHSSHKLIKNWNQTRPVEDQYSDEQLLKFQHYDWIEKDYLLAEFRSKIITVDQLHFAGGEPLIAPQMSQMLQVCIDLGVSKNIILTYNTNITVLPDEVLKLWKHFKGVRLFCSVDGVGAVNDYIRPPSKWHVIDKNLMYLDQHFHELNIIEIILSCTVQLYNILDLAELYTYLQKFKHVAPLPDIENLVYPSYLRTTLLPQVAKLEVEKELTQISQELAGKIPAEFNYLHKKMDSIINFMNSEDRTHQLPVFRKMNTAIDKNQAKSLFTAIPSLHNHLMNFYIEQAAT